MAGSSLVCDITILGTLLDILGAVKDILQDRNDTCYKKRSFRVFIFYVIQF